MSDLCQCFMASVDAKTNTLRFHTFRNPVVDAVERVLLLPPGAPLFHMLEEKRWWVGLFSGRDAFTFEHPILPRSDKGRLICLLQLREVQVDALTSHIAQQLGRGDDSREVPVPWSLSRLVWYVAFLEPLAPSDGCGDGTLFVGRLTRPRFDATSSGHCCDDVLQTPLPVPHRASEPKTDSTDEIRSGVVCPLALLSLQHLFD